MARFLSISSFGGGTVRPIVSAASPPFAAGQPFSWTPTVMGGFAPYLFTLAAAPGGITINAKTGVVSGTPASVGTATVTVKDAMGSTSSVVIGGAALPVLPLTMPKVVMFGDSQSQFNHAIFGGTGATIPAATYKGPVVAAWAKDPRFNIDTWADPMDPLSRGFNGANQGLGGDHFRNQSNSSLPGGGILARIPYAVARAPQVAILNSLGTNTIHSGDIDGSSSAPTADYVIAQIKATIAAFVQAGIYVVPVTIYPRNWNAGDVRHTIVQTVNAFIRDQAGKTGVLGVVDAYDALRVPGDVQPNPKYFLEESGAVTVHLNGNGTYLVGNLIHAVMAPATTAATRFNVDPAVSNLLPQATYNLPGTTGTRTGGNTTNFVVGTDVDPTGEITAAGVATGCNAYMSRGTSSSRQKCGKSGTQSSTVNKQILLISPVADAAPWHQSRFTFPQYALTPTQVPAGGWVRVSVRVDTRGAKGPANVFLQATLKSSAGTVRVDVQPGQIDSIAYNNTKTYSDDARGQHWISALFQMPADGDYATLDLAVFTNFRPAGFAAGDVFSLLIDRPLLRVATDPRATWNL
ncbi:putative Ig domain-containing protein [Sphingobium sp. CCH11-B1]|uniref:putative Ig domain-containing protein n=1 Tax=Sphingobium sp. CCH11-B1 TaxID=1768781 RepID=UPI0022B2327B|nr:putative Ig domain-containing protein [Sphingobium sp. CCH11-B1]